MLMFVLHSLPLPTIISDSLLHLNSLIPVTECLSSSLIISAYRRQGHKYTHQARECLPTVRVNLLSIMHHKFSENIHTCSRLTNFFFFRSAFVAEQISLFQFFAIPNFELSESTNFRITNQTVNCTGHLTTPELLIVYKACLCSTHQ